MRPVNAKKVQDSYADPTHYCPDTSSCVILGSR
jgi:hypothetical protein